MEDLRKLPYVDRDRIVMAGQSAPGYGWGKSPPEELPGERPDRRQPDELADHAHVVRLAGPLGALGGRAR